MYRQTKKQKFEFLSKLRLYMTIIFCCVQFKEDELLDFQLTVFKIVNISQLFFQILASIFK